MATKDDLPKDINEYVGFEVEGRNGQRVALRHHFPLDRPLFAHFDNGRQERFQRVTGLWAGYPVHPEPPVSPEGKVTVARKRVTPKSAKPILIHTLEGDHKDTQMRTAESNPWFVGTTEKLPETF